LQKKTSETKSLNRHFQGMKSSRYLVNNRESKESEIKEAGLAK